MKGLKCSGIIFVNFFQVAKKCLPFYKEYFGIGYLLPKLDLIAIQDFVIGNSALLIDIKICLTFIYVLKDITWSHSNNYSKVRALHFGS